MHAKRCSQLVLVVKHMLSDYVHNALDANELDEIVIIWVLLSIDQRLTAFFDVRSIGQWL